MLTAAAPGRINLNTVTRYRPDIDGLRGIAVLMVLVYHASSHWLPGGYVGVDVFFVVSGFLIAGIIFDDLDRGTFSFWNFYNRRIRRICPALIFILLAATVCGWLILPPQPYSLLGK